MIEHTEIQPPLACNLAAFTPEQRARYQGLVMELRAKAQEVKELPDGFAFRYPSEQAVCLQAMEFITLERLCCPFLAFALEVEAEGGPLWVRLTGRAGVKDFLRLELGLPLNQLSRR